MSTPFNVRQMASEAGIQTTGGFAVIAECVTLDELERFAHIAISAATKTLATANYENQCELEERIENLERDLAQAKVLLSNQTNYIKELQQINLDQNKQLADAKVDAERYRLIRRECMWEPRYVVVHVSTPAPAWETVRTPMELDESIDHFIAMKESKE